MAKTKVELQNYQGESLSPITIASNVLYEDGRNAQEVFEEYSNETFTPTIENSSSMFKVGQGDNVDYSDNIVNGAYESMVLKGKTMVNCIQEPSSQDVVLPYEFADGQYVTINDTKESGALGVELKGQTLVNLAKVRTATAYNRCSEKNIAIKPNTKYIALFNPTYYEAESGVNYALLLVSSVSLNDNIVSGDNAYTLSVSGGLGSEYKPQKGDKHLIFTSKTNETYLHIRTGGNNGILYTDMMILEYQEGMENWDIPYFTGMASCKTPTLTTTGKNLYNLTLQDFLDGEVYGNTRKVTLKFKPNTQYTCSSNLEWSGGSATIFFNGPNSGNNGVGHQTSRTTTSNEQGEIFIAIATHSLNESFFETLQIQIEEGSVATSYEPYKSSILSTSEDVELRGVGGVRDELNLLTGEVTERIGKIILDGTQSSVTYSSQYSNDDYYSFIFNMTNDGFEKASPTPIGISCPIPFQQNKMFPWTTAKEFVLIDSGGNTLIIKLLKSKLNNDNSISSLNTYLASNPITINYPLKTESVKTVDLKVVDQNGNVIPTLKSWNTTTHIYSEIPENTLYPILSHSNPTYPVILKPSTKYSIVANSYSNNHTNSTINFNLGGATATTTVGNRVTTVTTPSTLSNELLTMSGRGNKLNNVMVIEGDVVGDEPYFEGICDCKSPILSNVGKNLFNKPYFDNMDNLLNNIDAYVTYKIKAIKLKPDTVYTISHEGGIVKPNIWSVFNINATSESKIIKTIYNMNNWMNSQSNQVTPLKSTFMSPSDGLVHLSCYSRYKDSSMTTDIFTEDGMFTRVLKNIQLEEISASTAYEPYKSNTTTFEQKDGKTIVLRSLPSGVCDTLNVETGEYVQRIGEVVLDGSYIAYSNQSDGGYPSATSTAVLLNLKSSEPPQNRIAKFVCKDLPHYSASDSIWMRGTPVNTGISGVSGAWDFCIRLPYTVTGGAKTDSNDVIRQKFKDYLNENPVTVQYELATPIVSTIDVQGFPYAYENGHVQLSSGHSGQSLTPKVEYSVATNRNGQIRSNQKMVERHQKQLDQLQAMIISNMVNTQYQQTLTTLNYDLLKKEVGE